MRRQTAGFAILALLFASLSFAQGAPPTAGASVPSVIRFSGTLAVPPGPVPIRFGLYQEETGGTPLSAFVLAGETSGVGADGLTYVDARVLARSLAAPDNRAARGTPASPTAVQAADILGGLAVRGYGATTFSAGRG
jgi:hypothetical protein